MFGSYSVAYLSGNAFGNETVFREAEQELTELGYITFAPIVYTLEDDQSFGSKPNILDQIGKEKLAQSDIVVLVTPEQINQSTRKEIRQAIAWKKPIYRLVDGQLQEWSSGTRLDTVADRTECLGQLMDQIEDFLDTEEGTFEVHLDKDRYASLAAALRETLENWGIFPKESA